MGTESAGAKNKNARALLLKNFAVTTPRPSKAGKPVIRKQSKTIQMMKLRQAAKPGEAGLGIESIPQQERIYVQARAEDEFRPFWFRKVGFVTASLLAGIDQLTDYLNGQSL